MAKSSGPNFFWDKLVPTIYSAGAAVVILGALFKIQHWEGGGPMLTAGLGTEVLIFLLYALQTLTQPVDKEPDWTRVYPELSDDYNGPAVTARATAPSSNITAKLDNMLDNAKLTPDVFDNLGKGFRNLSETVGRISDL